MKFQETPLKGLFLVELDQRQDERGWFAEAFNVKVSASRNLDVKVDQVNFSTSRKAGTFRGLHYQTHPMGQTKTVFSVRGEVLDIAVDVRRSSQTYLQSFTVTLHPEGGWGLYIPPGFAHGWYSRTDDAQIMYLVKGMWSKSHERGLRFDDPGIHLRLPGAVSAIQERDKTWPLTSLERI